MENRSGTPQDLVAIPHTPTDKTVNETSLTEAALHALVQFFQRLDRWDREVVQ
jgi:hypothetical protein